MEPGFALGDLREAALERTALCPAAGQVLRDRLFFVTRSLRAWPPGERRGPHLLLLAGNPGTWLPLTGEFRIGSRPENDLRLESPLVSRQHCRLYAEAPGAWSVEDLGSRNGTHVNGERTPRRLLRDGDVLQVGDATLIFARLGE